MSVPENMSKVIIFTHHYQVEGYIAHFPDTRLTDFLRETHIFIAVTQAEVRNREGKKILEAPFLNVGRDQIEIVVPKDTKPLTSAS